MKIFLFVLLLWTWALAKPVLLNISITKHRNLYMIKKKFYGIKLT